MFKPNHNVEPVEERWLREFGQSAKWSARGLSQR
ncbi:hypothetical protein B7759_05773 (plasmid) [Burkholderia glumae]|nr:hypothetical protein B7759_05773 [Burkholderia glumae]